MTKSPLGRRPDAPLDHLDRGQEVGERDGAEIVAEGRAGDGGRRLQGGDAGADGDGDARPGGIGGAFQQLEHQRRQGVDAGVAGADQGHVAALGGAGQREAAALDLGTEREVVARLAGGGGADQVEIEAVADQLLGLGQQLLRLARAPAQVARPEADDGEPALRAADGCRHAGRAAPGRRRR